MESRVVCTFIGNWFDSCLRPRKVEGALIMRTAYLRQAGSIHHEDRIPTTIREHWAWGPYSYDKQGAFIMRTVFLRQAGSIIDHEGRNPMTNRENWSWGPYSYYKQRALITRAVYIKYLWSSLSSLIIYFLCTLCLLF